MDTRTTWRQALVALIALGIMSVGARLSLGQCGTYSQTQKVTEAFAPAPPSDLFIPEFGRVIAAGSDGTTRVLAVRVDAGGRSEIEVYEMPVSSGSTGQWQLTGVLEQPAGPNDDSFGTALAVKAQRTGTPGRRHIFVGAPDATTADGRIRAGVVHVYHALEGGAWSYLEAIQPSSGIPLHQDFGKVLAWGNRLLIADPNCCNPFNENHRGKGRVGVYTHTTGTPQFVLEHNILSNTNPDDNFSSFGRTLAMDGWDIIVGNARGNYQHYDYTFLNGSYQAVHKQSIFPWSEVGLSSASSVRIAIDSDENVLVLGFPNNPYQVPNSPYLNPNGGAAAVWTRANATSPWAFESLLNTITPPHTNRRLGDGLAIVDDPGANTFRIAVGAPSLNSTRASAHIFARQSGLWPEIQTLGGTAFVDAALGTSLAAAGQVLVVGAPELADTPIANYNGGVVSYYAGNSLPFVQTQVMREQNPNANNQFGSKVVTTGEWTFISAPFEHRLGVRGVGAVYVMRRVNGVLDYRGWLQPPNSEANDNFGLDLAVSGNYLAVACPNDDHESGSAVDCGSVVIYEKDAQDNWVMTQRLYASDFSTSDFFGTSVTLVGSRLVVGAQGDDNANGSNAGAVYVFNRDAAGVWSQASKVLAPDGAATDRFGISVATGTSGIGAFDSFLYVGAYLDDDFGSGSGSVYEFKLTPIIGGSPVWTYQRKFLQPAGAANDNFGQSIAFQGTSSGFGTSTLVVASPLDDTAAGVDAGSVHIFTKSGSTWSSTVTSFGAIDAQANEWFGSSLAMSGSDLLIGAQQENNAGGSLAGAAYLYRRVSGVWTHQQTFRASDRAAGDRLGSSVALSGDMMLAGAPTDDNVWGSNAGALYVFEVASTTPTVTTHPQDAQACAGFDDQIAFNVSVSGPGPFSYNWQANAGSGWFSIPAGSYFFGTVLNSQSETLIVNNAVAGSIQFRCDVSNACGTSISNIATMSVLGSTPVHFTQQPNDQFVCLGETATFSVAVSGSGPFSYQWYRRSQSLLPFPISGATSSQVQIVTASPDETYFNQVYCVVTTPCQPSGVTSDIARFGVQGPMDIEVLQLSPFVCGTTGQLGITSESSVFYFSSSGWYKDGVLISSCAASICEILTLSELSTSNNGSYVFGLTTPCGVIFSQPIVIEVTGDCGCDSIDFNNDGLFPDDTDLIDLLSVLAGGACSTDPSPGCNDIDFNNDGLFPDDSDLLSFLSVFAGGPC